MLKEIATVAGETVVGEKVEDIETSRITSIEAANRILKNMYDKLGEQNIEDKIFNYTDEDFSNVFEFDNKIDELIQQFSEEKWNGKTNTEKKNLIHDISNSISEKLDIEENVDVEFFFDDYENCGCFDERNRCIWINENTFTNPKEVLDTISHELKHVYQRVCADRNETFLDAVYKYNFEHYISPVEDRFGNWVNYMEYYNQFIEAEARAFAKQFVERI